MYHLSNTTLKEAADDLTAAGVGVPTYDRSALTVGIVHFGVGGFHRAHQAMYLDRLMNQGQAHDWAICGVGVLPGDRAMQRVMQDQDGLYTLVLKNPDGTTDARIIGSIVDYLFAPDDPDAVIERMAAATTRIVSLTITEGGYNIDHATGEFNALHPAVMEDLMPGAQPATTFGLVIEALRRRRDRGLPPFTVMSCDNIQGNGDVARRMFSSFATLVDQDLGKWVEQNVSFPNSMVDRITPVTTDADRDMVKTVFDIDDAWPVVCEDYEQWVLEDSFPLGRPALESVGVQLVNDVEPYELMKLRLLNASHQAQCYLGTLAGYTYAHEVCQDPQFAGFLLDYMNLEATPTLHPVPGIDLDEYKHTLIARFSNEYVKDTLARLCAETSDRIPKWLLPVIRENLEHGQAVSRSAAVVASWAVYAEGHDEQGKSITLVDRLATHIIDAASRNREDPLSFLRQADIFGDLVYQPEFTQPYMAALEALHTAGTRALLHQLADRTETTSAQL